MAITYTIVTRKIRIYFNSEMAILYLLCFKELLRCLNKLIFFVTNMIVPENLGDCCKSIVLEMRKASSDFSKLGNLLS